MPRGTARTESSYRIALGVALVLALITAAFGMMPLALMVAAFAIPVVYIVYLYDVNQWEDEPLLVTVLAFVLTFVLAGAFTWGISQLSRYSWRIADGKPQMVPTTLGILGALIIIPIIGEVIRQIGPIILARRPEFDDLMDGLTFGVVSGVAFAAAETVVAHRGLFATGFGADVDPLSMISLMILHGFIKPILYGTATGLACAEFSGLGKGYDGFTPRYFRGFLVAVLAIMAFSGGVYFLDLLPSLGLKLFLEILLGLVISACLILMLRSALHLGLLEASAEASARREGATTESMAFCPSCEMPLVPGSSFCSTCGQAMAASPRVKGARAQVMANPAAPEAADPATTTGGSTDPADTHFDKEETGA